MSNTSQFNQIASNLPSLAALFRWFNRGRHLNRISEPVLWEEFERNIADYHAIFRSLGYELRLDGRGFAWFHQEHGSSNTNKATRQLALLFMVIFDTQADAGIPLMKFEHWHIDRTLLTTVYEQHQDLLDAEEIDLSALVGLMKTAENFGFARFDSGAWHLLPAVCRYLDHYEELASQVDQDEDVSWAGDQDEEDETE